MEKYFMEIPSNFLPWKFPCQKFPTNVNNSLSIPCKNLTATLQPTGLIGLQETIDMGLVTIPCQWSPFPVNGNHSHGRSWESKIFCKNRG